MEKIAVIEGDAAPLSLYIDLEEGSRGDLEVISRAAIAWSQMIREAALSVDPFLEVRVELVSGTAGSINLNSLIRAVRDTVNDPKRLKAIAIAIVAYFGSQAGGWVVGKGYDDLWLWVEHQLGHEVVSGMSEADKRNVEKIVTNVVAAKTTQAKAEGVYAELSKDPTVTGVGVSLKPAVRPRYVVPRSEFASRAGVNKVIEETIERRTETDRLTLTLLSPVLSAGEYKWKFELGSKTVWALMADADFIARLQPGSHAAPRMVTGIRMSVDVETVQEKQAGVWTTMSQKVTKVHGMSEPAAQPSWLDAPVQDEDPK